MLHAQLQVLEMPLAASIENEIRARLFENVFRVVYEV